MMEQLATIYHDSACQHIYLDFKGIYPISQHVTYLVI